MQTRMWNMAATGLLLLAAGCVSTSAVRFDQAQRAPTAGAVEVHTNPSSIYRPYTEIGLITVDDGEAGEWGMSDENRLVQLALDQARQMGADGIILSLDGSVRNFGYGGAANSARTVVVRAVAFVYNEQPPAATIQR